MRESSSTVFLQNQCFYVDQTLHLNEPERLRLINDGIGTSILQKQIGVKPSQPILFFVYPFSFNSVEKKSIRMKEK